MSDRVLQKLLTAGEYDEIEDVVTAEGEFIESRPDHIVTRQVFLGLTPENLLIACRHLVNYKLNPEVFYETSVDPDIDGLQVTSVWPLCLIQIVYSTSKYELTVNMYHVTRHYELANTHLNGNVEETWAKWQERVFYLHEDPYHYIRDMYDEHNLPYPHYYKTQESKENQMSEVINPGLSTPLQVKNEQKVVKSKNRKKKKRSFFKKHEKSNQNTEK